MFSATGAPALPNSRYPHTSSVKVPRGYSVHVLKGPNASSVPYAAATKFDQSRLETPEPRQQQNWYPSRTENTSKPRLASQDSHKVSLFPTPNNFAPNTRGYDVNHTTTSASYSIYPGVSNDTYIYERSISAKSDIYSLSEYDALSATGRSSVFSPAMSTDSTLTLKSPVISEAPAEELSPPPPPSHRSSVPPTSAARNTFPIALPGLAQAKSAIKGIFQNTPQDDRTSQPIGPYTAHAPSGRSSAMPDARGGTRYRDEERISQGRPATLIRGSSLLAPPVYPTSVMNGMMNQPRAAQETPSDDDHDDVDEVARANAAYNAASSASYFSAENPVDEHDFHISASETDRSDLNVSAVATGEENQLLRNVPLHSSPEQQFSTQNRYINARGDGHPQSRESAHVNSEYQPARNRIQAISNRRYSIESDQFIPPLAQREWEEDIGSDTISRVKDERQCAPQSNIRDSLAPRSSSRAVLDSSRYMVASPANSSSSRGSSQDQARPVPVPPPMPQQRGSYSEERLDHSAVFSGMGPFSRGNSEDTDSFIDLESQHPDKPRRRGTVDQRLSLAASHRPSTDVNRSTNSIPSVINNPPPSRNRSSTMYLSSSTQLERALENQRTSPPLSASPPVHRSYDRVMRGTDPTVASQFPAEASLESPRQVADARQGANGALGTTLQAEQPQVPRANTNGIINPESLPYTQPAAQVLAAAPSTSTGGSKPNRRRRTYSTAQVSEAPSLPSPPLIAAQSPPKTQEQPPANPPANPPADPSAELWRGQFPVERSASSTVTGGALANPGFANVQPPPTTFTTDMASERSKSSRRNRVPSMSQSRPPKPTNSPPTIVAQNPPVIQGPLAPRTSAPLPIAGDDYSQPRASASQDSSPEHAFMDPPGLETRDRKRDESVSKQNDVRSKHRRDSIATPQRYLPLYTAPAPMPEKNQDNSISQQVPYPAVPPFERNQRQSAPYMPKPTYAEPVTLPSSMLSTSRNNAAPNSNYTQLDTQQIYRSRTPYLEARAPEPYRRHSDGDRTVATVPTLPRNATPYPHHQPPDQFGDIGAVPQDMSSMMSRPNLEAYRRRSDGDQTAPPKALVFPDNSLFNRSVRWDENLICPSPIFPNQRRKGWFNRRGDQLWTNEGAYKPPLPGQEYPVDLDGYPDYGTGWMNEEGVRIDMSHRLIPKPRPRSALKQRSSRAQAYPVDTYGVHA